MTMDPPRAPLSSSPARPGTGRPACAFLAALLVLLLLSPVGPAGAQQTGATPRFKTIWVEKIPLRVEVADTLEKQERGLMFRSSLPDNEGMLFVYRDPIEMSFWMRNTLIPLDIAFVGADGVILNIHKARPLDESVLYRSAGAAKYVIETNQGWFSRHGFGPGAKVRFSR